MRKSNFHRPDQGLAAGRVARTGRRALLTTTALVAGGLVLALTPGMVRAQTSTVIEDRHEILDGDGVGVGSPPSTRGGYWDGGNAFWIGTDSPGQLTIRNGGAFYNRSNTFLGRNVSGVGEVLVTGAGSTWVSESRLAIGWDGRGILTIADGGAVDTGHIYIGEGGFVVSEIGVGAHGDVVVTGAGSTLTGNGDLFVGYYGTGTLTIADGGAVFGTNAEIAFGMMSMGDVIVTGAGSRWINSSFISVGHYGSGVLTIADGGMVRAADLRIGRLTSSTGVLNIGAAAGDAAAAAGFLDTPLINLWNGSSTIVFNHTDDDFEVNAEIRGNGAIRVLSGRTLLSGANSYAGSTLLEGGTLTLGSDTALGASTLTTLGSVVGYADGVTIGNSIIIDSNTTQFEVLTGSATQTGVISELNGPRPFEKIGGGELVLTADNTWTGSTTVRDGTLTFDGGFVALAFGGMGIGVLAGDDAALIIRNGGAVSGQESYLGIEAGAVGTATVTGVGSRWANSAGLYVGSEGDGTLTITDGGVVSNGYSWVGD
ncbi:MAG: autotransporter-associated beta strand repeat-containing protein, partial [Brevundimonas sp.]